MKKNNRKGFTLAELLIVVAIIAVLVAVAIPVFTGQLENARDATTVANLRAAYAEAMVEQLESDSTAPVIIENVRFENSDKKLGSYDDNLPFKLDASIESASAGEHNVTFSFSDTTVTASISGS